MRIYHLILEESKNRFVRFYEASQSWKAKY